MRETAEILLKAAQKKGEDFLKELLDKQNHLEATALRIAATKNATAVLKILWTGFLAFC